MKEQTNLAMQLLRRRNRSRPLLALSCLLVMISGCQRPSVVDEPDELAGTNRSVGDTGVVNKIEAAQPQSQSPGTAPPLPSSPPSALPSSLVLDVAPGLADRHYISPLADAYRRLDPSTDGWESEAVSSRVAAQLEVLRELLESSSPIRDEALTRLITPRFQCADLLIDSASEVFRDETFVVRRWDEVRTDRSLPHAGIQGFVESLVHLVDGFDASTTRHAKFKLYRVNTEQRSIATEVLFHLSGSKEHRPREISSTWHCGWTVGEDDSLRLSSIRVVRFEDVVSTRLTETLFDDATQSLLGSNDSFARQLLRGTDYWRGRLPQVFGLDVVANHGFALGDVNGDGLDDLYLCQQGGLPNRLFIQQPDGTLLDHTSSCGADWLDYCASALLVDLDNDGDRDLVVGQESSILFMFNDGSGYFELKQKESTFAQVFSLAAADFDLDGDLDLYVCGYNASLNSLRTQVMGEPMPYHDANNGGRNTLFRNGGSGDMTDVTQQVGLAANNTRFSFAASWEDFDHDGDPDLYVANDYGRNNLYVNDGGRFDDRAADAGVEDMSAGMSANWADFNRDGWMDLYVSNMFSAAGNRIAFQRQFKQSTDEKVRSQYRRHARGNTLFANLGNGAGFQDVSEQARVTMGRWAWGSRFVDFNNDGWEDLVVANGFITSSDTGDL